MHQLNRKWMTWLAAALVSLAAVPAMAQQMKAPVTREEAAQLKALSAQLDQRYHQRLNVDPKLRRAAELPFMRVAAGNNRGRKVSFMGFSRFGSPLFYATESNVNAAKTIRTDLVQAGGSFGTNLNGSSRVVHEWDGGAVRGTHQEFGGRVVQVDGATTLSDHATHVAGTLIASGVSTNAKGMATLATLNAYDWNNDASEMATAGANGAVVSNHSYGFLAGWYFDGSEWFWYGQESVDSLQDWSFGYYDDDAAAWDQIALNAPFYLICKSAGNNRGYAPAANQVHKVYRNGAWVTSTKARTNHTYDCMNSNTLAKNILTVGAVSTLTSNWSTPSNISMASFSSWGPVDDGRIKPDICAMGVGLLSAGSAGDASYTTKNGTSMATPNATGSLVLVQEYYNRLKGVVMRAATLKALAIGTAWEAGTSTGPDYRFGWGLMNTAGMITAINQNGKGSAIIQKTLSNGGRFDTTITVGPGQVPKVTLVWHDRPGTPNNFAALNNRTKKLVNDLDLRLVSPGNTTYFPYKLDPANPANAATTGDNVVDNVEQVEGTAATGTWQVKVSHKGTLVGSTQPYSIVITGISPITTANTYGIFFSSPAANASFAWNSTVNAAWFNNGTGTNYKIELKQGANVMHTLASNYSSPGGNYQFTVPSTLPGGSYNLTVTDLGTQASTGSVPITITQPAPTISGISPTSGGWGTTVTITGTNLTGATAVKFNNVNATSFNVVSATSITAVAPQGAGSGFMSVTTPGGTISSAPFIFTTTTTSISSISRVSTTPTNASSVSFTVTFGATVTGVTTSNFDLSTTGITGASVTGISGSGSTRTVTVNTGSGSGTLFLRLANSTGISPDITTALPFSGQSYTIDKTAPTVTISSTAGNPTTTSPIPLSITFSETVNGFSSTDLVVTNGTASGISGTGASYTCNITPSAAGLVEVSIPANSATDGPGNGNTASNNFSITYNLPQVSISSITRNNANPSKATSVSFTVTFSASVTGVTTSNFDVTSTGVSGASITGISGSGSSRQLTVNTGTGDGTITLRMVNGNGLNATISSSLPYSGQTYSIDKTQPTVTVSSTASSPTSTSPIPLTFTFSESVTGFAQSDISVTNGSLSGFSGSGASYTCAVTPTGPGDVLVSVGATVATDAATNANLASNSFSISYELPPVSISSINRSNVSPNNATGLNYTVTFSGSVTGVTAANFDVIGSGVTGASVTGVTGSGATRSVAVNTGSGSGTITLRLVNSTGISPAVSTSLPFSGQSYAIDKTFPALTISSSASNPTAVSPIPLTFTFSEAVTGFTVSDISVTNGTLGTLSGSGTSYSCSVTPTLAGQVQVSVGTGAASDAVGNGSLPSNAFAIAYAPIANLTVTTPQNVAAGTYNTITVENGGVMTLTGNVQIDGSITVKLGGTVDLSCFVISGAGSFDLQEGAYLKICNPDGISATGNTGGVTVTGTRTFAQNAEYEYNGSAPQITGTGLPQNVMALAVNNSAGVSLSRATTVTNRLVLTSGVLATNDLLTLASNANGTAVVNNVAGTATGLVTAQRWVDPALNAGTGFRYYSAPVSGQAFSGLSANGSNFTPVLNTAYNTAPNVSLVSPYPNVFGFDMARVTGSNLSQGWYVPGSGTMQAGQGYAMIINAGATLKMRGQLNNGSVSYSQNGGSDPALYLVGNPYPSPIDWTLVGKNNIDDALFLYQSTSSTGGRYASYINGISTHGASPILPMGQGFFVRSSGGNVNLSFDNSARLTTGNPSFFRQQAAQWPLVRLAMSTAASTQQDETVVYFHPQATTGYDGSYDAMKIASPFSIYSYSGSSTYSINAMPEALLTAGQPLAITMAVSTPAAGTYTLKLSELGNFGTNSVALFDQQLNVRTPLVLNTTYQFTTTGAGLNTGRFVLEINGIATSAKDQLGKLAVSLWPNPAHDRLQISGLTGTATVQLIDALGKTVLRQAYAPGQELDLSQLPAGVYQVQCQQGDLTSQHKLVKQ